MLGKPACPSVALCEGGQQLNTFYGGCPFRAEKDFITEAFFFFLPDSINEFKRRSMQKIPILFLEDDDQLISMYRDFLSTKGYNSILIRNGQKGLEQAIVEGPSLLTLKAYQDAENNSNNLPVLIFTNKREPKRSSKYFIKPAILSSEVFGELKSLIQETTP